MEDTTLMFFDKNFNPVNYIDALYQNHSFNKADLNKLLQISNNLIIHYNFLIQNLNSEIDDNLKHLTKLTNENGKLEYYAKSLQIAVASLDKELSIPKFNQLVVINDLINFKHVKSQIQQILSIFKILVSLGKGKGEISLDHFEENLLAYYNSIVELQVMSEKVDKLNELIELNDCFKNLNNFNTIYKRNLNKFIQEKAMNVSDAKVKREI